MNDSNNNFNNDYHKTTLNNIHRALNLVANQFCNNKKRETFYTFLAQNILNLNSENIDEEEYYSKKTIQRFFSQKNKFPPLSFLISFCKLMDINLFEVMDGSFRLNSSSDDKQKLNKFLQNKGIYYLYFPSSKNDIEEKEIIHESTLTFTKSIYSNVLSATLSIPLPKNNKEYIGELCSYKNTAILYLKNNINPEDMMIIAVYNNYVRDNADFYGAPGYRISLSSDGIGQPSLAKCIISRICLKSPVNNSYQKNIYDEEFLGLFAMEKDKIVIKYSDYLATINEAKVLKTEVDKNVINLQNEEEMIILDLQGAVEQAIKHNLSGSRFRKFMNILNKKSWNYNQSMTIDFDMNKRIYKYIKSKIDTEQ